MQARVSLKSNVSLVSNTAVRVYATFPGSRRAVTAHCQAKHGASAEVSGKRPPATKLFRIHYIRRDQNYTVSRGGAQIKPATGSIVNHCRQVAGLGLSSCRAYVQLSSPKYALQGWGLHVWGDVIQPTPWSTPLPPSGLGPEGAYWDIKLLTSANHVGALIHKGEEKAAGWSAGPVGVQSVKPQWHV